MKPASFLSACLVFATSAAALSLGAPVDVRDAVSRIKAEGLTKSQVMDIAATLTDVHGARLTGSPGARTAPTPITPTWTCTSRW